MKIKSNSRLNTKMKKELLLSAEKSPDSVSISMVSDREYAYLIPGCGHCLRSAVAVSGNPACCCGLRPSKSIADRYFGVLTVPASGTSVSLKNVWDLHAVSWISWWTGIPANEIEVTVA